ncbi:hypothetical protein [Desulfonatronum thiodismutans]|uniref:hypothetical protein n=1 Tax=Desulfonatronum thiodismutans TaxID=159290 RepID=UPI0012678AE0|nr:hypothetical protein [Desulfonatronum thiodismutans]
MIKISSEIALHSSGQCSEFVSDYPYQQSARLGLLLRHFYANANLKSFPANLECVIPKNSKKTKTMIAATPSTNSFMPNSSCSHIFQTEKMVSLTRPKFREDQNQHTLLIGFHIKNVAQPATQKIRLKATVMTYCYEKFELEPSTEAIARSSQSGNHPALDRFC